MSRPVFIDIQGDKYKRYYCLTSTCAKSNDIYDISVPDIKLGGWCRLCVARAPDEKFVEGAYWACYGPNPSDDDSDVFVVPFVIPPYSECLVDNWARVCRGTFITTENGVILVDVDEMWAWEGYSRPGERDYNFDRRRLEKSAAALKVFAGMS